MQLCGFFLTLISATTFQHIFNKNNLLTSISDPEEIQNAETPDILLFLEI